jgi:hypothetical protein
MGKKMEKKTWNGKKISTNEQIAIKKHKENEKYDFTKN